MTTTSLHNVKDKHMSIKRQKYGKGFQYFYRSGEKIDCAKTLKRIKRLVIPPMWRDVKICELENGHIQSTGYDLKSRKQYIYHNQWHLIRQTEKFKRIVSFAKKLPEMRQLCLEKLANECWDREKVLALMVLILDETGVRIGNNRYSRENETYGLSTLRRKHVQISGSEIVLDYIGKHGKRREVEIEDDLLTSMIQTYADFPGYSLFRYKNEVGNWEDIDSDDVNDFIKQCMGDKYSCKDFRTWAGTRLAYEMYPKACQLHKTSPRKQLINILVEIVSNELGNTPSICRQYYIHPEILRRVKLQNLPLDDSSIDLNRAVSDPSFSPAEIKLLNLLGKTK